MEFLIQFWENYPVLVDFALYFLLFAAVARAAFAKTFPSYEGRILAVAVGLFLAAGLAFAQRKLGFSTSSIGPVAIFLIGTVLFIAGYRFLQQSGLPKHLTIFFCIVLVAVLLRATMPEATMRFIHNNTGTIFLAVMLALAWAWFSAEKYVGQMTLQKPGHALEHFGLIPNQGLLAREKNIVKKGLKALTSADAKDERSIVSKLRRAQETLEKEGLKPGARNRIKPVLDGCLQKAQQIKEHGQKVAKIDAALRRFDLTWFHKMHAIQFGQLTPEQRKLVEEGIIEERRRIHAEEELEKLLLESDLHVQNMTEHMRRCTGALDSGNAAALSGWLSEAIKEAERTADIERAIQEWEHRLLSLVRRQRNELRNAE